MIYVDSRHIKPGDVFFALPGETVDGRQFIAQAIENGASQVCYEANGCEKFVLPSTAIPLVPIKDLVAKQGEMASIFYGEPSQHMTMIGVTGTNGKTSVTHFIAQCLADTAVIGTTGYGRLGAIHQLGCTTPAAPELHGYISKMLQDGCQAVAMEVSSHGLMQHRVDAVAFDIAVFTNLSQDHLDYHGTMAAYTAAKRRLFEWPTLKTIISNADDPVGLEFLKAGQAVQRLSYGMGVSADIHATNIQQSAYGFDCQVQTPWGKIQLTIPLIGYFNLYNVLATIGVCGVVGLSVAEIESRLMQLQAPPGRLEVYHQPGQPTVVVDFAHTPDALEKVLQALKTHVTGDLWCVFGCGGDRDKNKRSKMGGIAGQYAAHVIITNDNPRTEDPATIAQHIIQGVVGSGHTQVVLDRRAAIQQAIDEAGAGDLVLIAGKGHEDYQIIGDQVLPFSDGEVVRKTLE